MDLADRLAPGSAVIAFRKAQLLERSGDLDGAIIGFESYLSRNPDAADRTEIERIIGVIRARVEAGKPRITVTSEPAGARVYIDAGGPDDGPSGLAPMAVRLHPGPHRFYVELDGHQPIDRVIEVSASRTLRFRLSKFDEPAILTIGGMDADTEGAPVFIDGIKRGRVPATIELEPGAHIVEVTKPGFETWINEYRLRRGQRMHIDMVLEPAYERRSHVAGATAKLVITTVPGGARVLVDGREFGPTPSEISGLTPGTHTLRISLGEESVLRSITLAPDKPRRFHHTFSAAPSPDPPAEPLAEPPVEPPLDPPLAPPVEEVDEPAPEPADPEAPPSEKPSKLRVATEPPDVGASVEVDGGAPAPAPWAGAVEPGRRAILVQAPGYETVIRDVEVPPTSEVTVTVPLRKATPPPERKTGRKAIPDRPLPARDRPGRVWAALALASADEERRTFRVGGDEASLDVPADETRVGVSVRWAKFLSDSTELGLSVDLMLIGADDQTLAMSPFVRLRLPFRDDDGDLAELYLLGSGGLTAVHGEEHVQGGKVASLGGGWNAAWLAGAQLSLTGGLGLFVDGGIRLQSVSHALLERDGAEIERGAYDRRRTDLTFNLGVAWSP